MVLDSFNILPQDCKPSMWRPYCEAEKGWLMVGKGEPCNWCEEKEALGPAEPKADAIKEPR
jgi:hypothetical protein